MRVIFMESMSSSDGLERVIMREKSNGDNEPTRVRVICRRMSTGDLSF